MKSSSPKSGEGLQVRFGDRLAGRLSLDAGRRFVFQYSPEWIEGRAPLALSVSLPLRAEPYLEDSARPFFANLLPEAGVREAIAKRLGVSDQNDFALLELLGGECAGTVSLWPDALWPKEPRRGDGRREGRRKIERELIDELLADLPHRPLLQARGGVRLSLAGAQEKLPVLRDGADLFLPDRGSPSTHILKPPIRGLEGTVENECFCMTLADRAGLLVPPVELLRFGSPLFLIRRFDRSPGPGGKIERIHQEDFCQAMGLLPDQKYESEGGPGLARCFRLLEEHSIRPLEDRRALLHWVIFNCLIGNTDGHAKNLSLLYDREGVRLAPFYDLLSTAIYPRLSPKLAQRVGGENRPTWIQKRHWERFAAEVGVKPQVVLDYCRGLAETLPGRAEKLSGEFAESEGGESPTIARILKYVEVSSARLLARIGA